MRVTRSQSHKVGSPELPVADLPRELVKLRAGKSRARSAEKSTMAPPDISKLYVEEDLASRPSSAQPRPQLVITNRKNDLKRKLKLVTEQHVIAKESGVENFPMREWSIRLVMLDEAGNEHPADCFNKVVYNLHPSFANPTQSFTKPPFTCKNEGWGEFGLTVDCYYTEKTKLTVSHDLNFLQEKYDNVQTVTFKNPSQALQEKLRELGPLATDDDVRPKKKGVASKKTSAQKYDYEKIAEALEKLEEDDLLKVIQIINDYKTDSTYIKSDVDVDDLTEAGEFSIDLYTMPDILTKTLWDHLSKKGLVS